MTDALINVSLRLGAVHLETRFTPDPEDGWHYGEVRRVEYDAHGACIKVGDWERTGVRVSFGD